MPQARQYSTLLGRLLALRGSGASLSYVWVSSPERAFHPAGPVQLVSYRNDECHSRIPQPQHPAHRGMPGDRSYFVAHWALFLYR